MEFVKENLRSVGSICSKSSHFSSFQNIRSVVTLCHSIVFFGRRSNEDGEYAYRSHNSIRTSRLLALTRYIWAYIPLLFRSNFVQLDPLPIYKNFYKMTLIFCTSLSQHVCHPIILTNWSGSTRFVKISRAQKFQSLPTYANCIPFVIPYQWLWFSNIAKPTAIRTFQWKKTVNGWDQYEIVGCFSCDRLHVGSVFLYLH